MVKNLKLLNFRNYAQLELNFDSRPTVLVGDNGAGKSNILEAVYLLSTTKSQRVGSETELIKQGEEFSKVQCEIATDPSDPRNDTTRRAFGTVVIASEAKQSLEVTMQILDNQFTKRVKVNRVPRRSVDFIGNLPAVIFYPSDINMVTGSPSLRRWHLDMGLAQIDPDYKKALSLYEQFLISRNRVLKRIREGLSRKDELDYWTEGLVKEADIISEKRQIFFDFVNNLVTELGEYKFKYVPSIVTLEKLNITNGREVAAAATLIGPHRDDYEVQIRNSKFEIRNLSKFGSRGEQRTATLAFKLALLEYMALILGKRPVLLLDDVFSELDASHRAHVVEVVSRQQTIIATVELENIPQEFLDSARILTIENGKIKI